MNYEALLSIGIPKIAPNYFKAYCEAREIISKSKNNTIKDHISHYEILEEVLGFQYFLQSEFRFFSKLFKQGRIN